MKKLTFKTCLTVISSLFLLYLAIHYWPAFTSFFKSLFSAAAPLILGFLIAYIVNLVMFAYEKLLFKKAKSKRIKRPVCMVLAFLTFVAVATLVVWLVIPQLIECIATLLRMLPGAIDRFLNFVAKHHLISDELLSTLDSIDWQSRVEQLLDVLTSGVSDVVTIVIQTLQSLISGVITTFLSLIFSFYLLYSKEELKSQASRVCKSFLPESFYAKLQYVLYNLNVSFRRYLIGQCTEAVILGLLCSVGMLILRLPYPAMISTLIAFTALIPVAGAYIGAGVGAFMILTVSPLQALIFLAYIIVLQQLEGNLIYPRVVGSSLGLPGIWVLGAVTVGGGIAGILGMFIGVPLTAAAYRMLRDAVEAREQKKAELEAQEASEAAE